MCKQVVNSSKTHYGVMIEITQSTEVTVQYNQVFCKAKDIMRSLRKKIFICHFQAP